MPKVAQKRSKCINMHQTMLKVTFECVFVNLWRELPPVHSTSPPSKAERISTSKEANNRQYASTVKTKHQYMISDINLTYQGGLSPKMLPNARG
jgi:hypothetical protein